MSIHTTVVVLLVLFIATGSSASAETSHVSNSISINASSGNNGADGADGANGLPGKKGADGQPGQAGEPAGEIFTGRTHSSVDITTTINGEVVEDVHEEFEDGSVSVISTTNVQGDTVESEVRIATSSGTHTIERKQTAPEIPLEAAVLESTQAGGALEEVEAKSEADIPVEEVGDEENEQISDNRETGGFVAKVRTFIANVFSYVTGWFS